MSMCTNNTDSECSELKITNETTLISQLFLLDSEGIKWIEALNELRILMECPASQI